VDIARLNEAKNGNRYAGSLPVRSNPYKNVEIVFTVLVMDYDLSRTIMSGFSSLMAVYSHHRICI